MKEYIIKKKKPKVMKIRFGDESYSIPLAGSLRPCDIKNLETVEATMNFIKKYIPAEVVDELTQDEYNDLIRAWGEASKDESETSVGE